MFYILRARLVGLQILLEIFRIQILLENVLDDESKSPYHLDGRIKIIAKPHFHGFLLLGTLIYLPMMCAHCCHALKMTRIWSFMSRYI